MSEQQNSTVVTPGQEAIETAPDNVAASLSLAAEHALESSAPSPGHSEEIGITVAERPEPPEQPAIGLLPVDEVGAPEAAQSGPPLADAETAKSDSDEMFCQQVERCLALPEEERGEYLFVAIEFLDQEQLQRHLQTHNNLDLQRYVGDRLAHCAKGIVFSLPCEGRVYTLVPGNGQEFTTLASDLVESFARVEADEQPPQERMDIVLAVVPLLPQFTEADQLVAACEELLASSAFDHHRPWKIYSEKTKEQQHERLRHDHELVQQALADRQIYLFFQPIASLSGGTDELYDVLLRVENQGEQVSAGRFFDSCDHTALAGEVDKLVVLKGLVSLVERRRKGEKNIRMFIHLCAYSVQDWRFLPWLYLLVKRSGIHPANLVFQVTERTAHRYRRQVRRIFDGIRKMGSHTCLCQFGRAPKAVHMAQDNQVDYVKFFGQLTDELNDNKPEAQRSLAEMIRTLRGHGTKTIVANVENPGVMTAVWRTGSDYVQGHFLQKPMGHMEYDFGAHG